MEFFSHKAIDDGKEGATMPPCMKLKTILSRYLNGEGSGISSGTIPVRVLCERDFSMYSMTFPLVWKREADVTPITAEAMGEETAAMTEVIRPSLENLTLMRPRVEQCPLYSHS